jgi:hypothetical protein
MFSDPVVFNLMELNPIETLARPVVAHSSDSKPKEVFHGFELRVQPYTTPSTVGVAAEPPPAVAHLTPEGQAESAVKI